MNFSYLIFCISIFILYITITEKYIIKNIDYYYPNFIIGNVHNFNDTNNPYNVDTKDDTNEFLNKMSAEGKHFYHMNLNKHGDITDLEFFVDLKIQFIYSIRRDTDNKLIKIYSYYDYWGRLQRYFLYAKLVN